MIRSQLDLQPQMENGECGIKHPTSHCKIEPDYRRCTFKPGDARAAKTPNKRLSVRNRNLRQSKRFDSTPATLLRYHQTEGHVIVTADCKRGFVPILARPPVEKSHREVTGSKSAPLACVNTCLTMEQFGCVESY